MNAFTGTFLFVFSLSFWSGCGKHLKTAAQPLPVEIVSHLNDSVILDKSSTLHFGKIEITDGIAVAQAFDKATRQEEKILLYDLNSKKNLGFFPWPDPVGSVYFGIAPYKNYLLYFSNYEYFRKVDIESKKIDTILIKSKISELVGMVIIDDKVYSLGNIYGINIVDINNTANQIFKRNYRGSYYNEQNNISLPVDENLNLVASCEIAPNQYAVYAIDMNMNVRWEKILTLKDRFLQIRSIHTNSGFLVKYDNKLELLSEANGLTLWTKEFDVNVYNMMLLNKEEIVLFLSKSSNGNRPMPNANSKNKEKIIKFNLKKQKVVWEIPYQGRAGELAFILGEYLFDSNDNNQWMKINLSTGKSTSFLFNIASNGSEIIEILCDKKTSKNYIRYGNSIYW